MLLQADAEFSGQRGLTDAALSCFLRSDPSGHAVEVRVYAENPAKDFRPAPGMLTNVKFPEGHGIRVDTWVDSGTLITPAFGWSFISPRLRRPLSDLRCRSADRESDGVRQHAL